MDKLVYIKRNDFNVPVWIEDFGNHNKLPTPNEEISESEFYRRWFWSTTHMEFRQPMKDGLGNTHIFWMHNEALAIVTPQREGESPRYFAIGCQHDLSESSTRMFEHNYTCKKCGYKYSTDSSG